MREIIPSLAALYATTVALLLMLMLLVAGISLYFNARNETIYQRTLFWSKLLISMPLLLLGVGWATFATVGFGVVALMSKDLYQTLFFLALALAPIAIYAIATWGVIRWFRNKRFADASVIITIVIFVSFVSFVYTFQRAWLCERLADSGVNIVQLCTEIE